MKRFLSILLCLAVMLQLAVIPAFAAGPEIGWTSEDGAADGILGLTVEAQPGDEEIIVVLYMDPDVEFMNIGLVTEFDTEALELVEVIDDAAVDVFTGSPSLEDQPQILMFTAGKGDGTSSQGGRREPPLGYMAELIFNVKADAYNGVYPITLSYYTGRDGNGTEEAMCFDKNKQNLNLQYVAGSITVTGGEDRPGGAVETTLNAEKSVEGNVTNVAIAATAETIEGKFIAAVYNGYQLVDAKVVDAAAAANVALNGTGDKVKVFWWNNTTDCVPYCAPVVK